MEQTRKIGRPTKYEGDITVEKVYEYIDSCVDDEKEFHKTRGNTSDSYERLVKVKLPTVPGLANYLSVNKDTLIEWAKEYPDFSVALAKMREVQEEKLINGSMSGDYNPVIAKLLLSSNHGYTEKSETTNTHKVITLTEEEKQKLNTLL